MAVMSPGSLLALWLLSSGFRLREPSVCRAHRWVRALTRYSDGMVNVLTSLCLEKSSKLSQEVGNIRNRSSDTWFGQVLSQLPNHHHSPWCTEDSLWLISLDEYIGASIVFMSGFPSGVMTLVKDRMARAWKTVFFLNVVGVWGLTYKTPVIRNFSKLFCRQWNTELWLVLLKLQCMFRPVFSQMFCQMLLPWVHHEDICVGGGGAL